MIFLLVKSRIRFPQPVYGQGYVQGLIQVYHDGQWGTICTQAFDSSGNGEKVANVLCRMGGYRKGSWDWGRYNQNVKRSVYKTWLHTVLCTGRENSLNECRHSPWGETRSICHHHQKKGDHMDGGHYYEACVRCYHHGTFTFINLLNGSLIKRLSLYEMKFRVEFILSSLFTDVTPPPSTIGPVTTVQPTEPGIAFFVTLRDRSICMAAQERET